MNTTIAAILLSTILLGQTPQPRTTDRLCFLVAPITAAPADRAWVATAIEQGLTWTLRRTDRTDAIPLLWRQRATADLARRSGAPADHTPDPKHLGQLLGANILITGQATASANELVAELTLHDLRTDTSTPCRLAAPDIAALLTKLAPAVMAAAKVTPAANSGPAPTMSDSAVAIAYFAKAYQAAQDNRPADAVTLCKRAGAYDSDFIEPRLMLALLRAQHGDPQPAMQDLQTVVRLAHKASDRIALARAQGNMGLLYRQIGKNTVAQRYFELAAASGAKADDPFTQATAANNLAQVHLQAGRLEPAIDAMKQRDQLLRRIGDKLAIGPNLTLLGSTYQQLSRFENALAALTEAVTYSETFGSSEQVAAALHYLGSVCQDLDRTDEAIQHYTRSIELAPEALAAPTCNNLGLIYQEKDQLPQASKAFEQAINLLNRHPDPPQLAVCLINAADVYEAINNTPKAIDRLEQAASILRRMRHPQANAIQTRLDALRAKQK